jgi:hypothetical protein
MWRSSAKDWVIPVVALGGLALVLAIAECTGRMWWSSKPKLYEMPSRIEPQQIHQFIGHKKSEIVDRFGVPNLISRGTFGWHDGEDQRGTITVMYRTDEGEAYLLFRQESSSADWDDWVCYLAQWLRKGASF